LIFSDLLNKNNLAVNTDQWYYSTEIRVLSTQFVYRIGLLLFPHDWHLARTFSISILLLILIAAAVFLVKEAGLGKPGLLAVGFMVWPFGQLYSSFVLFICFYISYIVISLLSIALLLRILHFHCEHHRPAVIQTVILAMLCFCAGLGGVRQMMICYVPLFAAAFVMYAERMIQADRLLSVRQLRKDAPQESLFLLLSLFSCVSAGAGYLINVRFLSQRYHFQHFSDSNFGHFTFTSLADCYSDFISLFGWQDGVDILSKKGIANVLSLLMGMLILYTAARLFRKRKELSLYHRILNGFFISLLLLDGFVFSCTSAYGAPYWIPILPFSLLILAIGYRNGSVKRPVPDRILCLVAVLSVILCSLCTMRNPFNPSNPIDNRIAAPAEWLVNNGYTQGYATFWNSDVLTELSNGKIEMWSVWNHGDAQNTDDLVLYEWLQPVSHKDQVPSGRFFILLRDDEADAVSAPALSEMPDHIVYHDNGYVIYSFDSMQDYLRLKSEKTGS
jgi:hypothetical protein